MDFYIYSILTISLFVVIAILGGIFSNKDVIISYLVTNDNKKGFLFYFLPESRIQIEHIVKIKFSVDLTAKTLADVEIIKHSFKTNEIVSADTSEAYTLIYKSNIFNSDEIEFNINEQGLIESGIITTEDKAPFVVGQMLGDLKEGAKGASALANQKANNVDKKKVIIEYSKTFEVSFQTLLASKVSPKGDIPNGNTLGRTTVQLQDNSKQLTQMEFKWDVQVSDDNAENIVTVPVLFAIEVKNPDHFLQRDEDRGKIQASTKGLLTRLKMNAILQFKDEKGNRIGSDLYLPVVDASRAVSVPIERTSFGKRIDTVNFKDGFPISHKIVQPSSYAGFASIPVDIAKALISIPAQLFSIKINTAKSQTELNKTIASLKSSEKDLEKSLIEQGLAIKKLEIELSEKSTELDQLAKNRDDNLNLLAEKNRKEKLETQKSILELQNEIAKLKKT